ncbi:peptide ABC transporter substrate-binding protein [Candidatus Saccharibacteria bacterium]|nr:peptide ABC transporter substrate-binding protein [Candidatus Saccharibacteria bacterium]
MAVFDSGTKRRWRRHFRRHQRGAVELGVQADQQIEKLLLRRLGRLVSVRRFIFLWISLFILMFFFGVIQLRALSPYYQSLKPVPGGIYSEGILSTFRNANPLYATTEADIALSHLVFAGLFKYDNANGFAADLAKDWSVGPTPTHYTVHLRQGLSWHDGAPFTADDVVFTYKTIQDIESQSALYSNWRDITVKKVDNYTVTFDLPNALSPFPLSLTNGIIPAHILKKIPPTQLRSNSFNSQPIGMGPFQWKFIELLTSSGFGSEQRITLAAFDKYWAGRPKLDGFNLLVFSNEQQLLNAFNKKQINAVGGLEALPDELADDSNVQVYNTPLTSAVMAFFNNSRGVFADAAVRRALVSGIDRQPLSKITGFPTQLVDSPLLHNQLGYSSDLMQLPYDPSLANQLLDQAGWLRTGQGFRSKNNQTLVLNLRSQNTRQYTVLSQYLQTQWAKLGVKVEVQFYDANDLGSQIIANHDYDILVYAINIGIDPDIFAYWNSSQASVNSQGHLNLSEYKSGPADQALEAGRTRGDPVVRVVKYRAFATVWRDDAPALALYQPNFLYVTRGPVFGYERKSTNTAADRFYNVQNWMIRQKRQTQQ